MVASKVMALLTHYSSLAEKTYSSLCSDFIATDMTKRLMSSPKCKSVEVINNPVGPGSNHMEVNYINYNNNNNINSNSNNSNSNNNNNNKKSFEM